MRRQAGAFLEQRSVKAKQNEQKERCEGKKNWTPHTDNLKEDGIVSILARREPKNYEKQAF